MTPAEIDVYFKVVAASVAGGFALTLVLWADGRAPRTLAAFFALIAWNQGIEAARVVAAPDRAVVLFKVASIAAAADPFVLMLFAYAVLFGRAPPARALVPVGIASAALALWAGWAVDALPTPDLASEAFPLALEVFTAATYATLALLAYRLLRERGAGEREALLFGALAFAGLPAIVRAMETTFRFSPNGIAAINAARGIDLLFNMAVLTALVAWVIRGTRDLRPQERRVAQGSVLGAYAIVLVSSLFTVSEVLARAGIGAPIAGLVVLGRASSAFRWLAFATLASMAIFRHDLMGMGVANRRRAARTLLGIASVLVAGGLFAWVEDMISPGTPFLAPSEIVVLLVVLLASQSTRRAIDDAAAFLYGVPHERDHEGAKDAYARAARASFLEGKVIERDPALQKLREDLGIDVAAATSIERAVQADTRVPIAIGTVVSGRFRVDSLIGAGGAGPVWLATDLQLRRRVALKEIADAAHEDAALREAQLAGSIQHDNIVVVHDVAKRARGALIVCEYVSGGDLERALAAGPLSPREAIALGRGVLAGVAAVHAHGIVHGDLKPANILLTPERSPKICDFGLARVKTGRTVGFADGDALAGTIAFMAPEQRRGAPASARSDVYALGLILQRCFGKDAPAALRALIDEATAEDPATRPADAAVMLAKFDAAVEGISADTRTGNARRR